MANDIIGFDGLIYFLKFISNDQTIQCVIRFARFVFENGRKRPLFSMFSKIGLYVVVNKFFFQANGITKFGGLYSFSHLSLMN